MAPCAMEEELGWWGQLGRTAKAGVAKLPNVLRRNTAETQWRSFDLADDMEMGLAKEITTSFMNPPSKEQKHQRLTVERSEDQNQHILVDKDGETVLIARNRKGSENIDFYIPTGGDPPTAFGPAFSLVTEDAGHKTWTLTSHRCECCEYRARAHTCCEKAGRRELARITHIREEIGPGTVMCMEVQLPELQEDGTPAVWCTRAGGMDQQKKLVLESKRPRWSPRLKSLTLDFFGRCNRASAKNFQLLNRGDGEKRANSIKDDEDLVQLLFGKTGDNNFVLDYKNPLGMIQAFAITLTTKAWK